MLQKSLDQGATWQVESLIYAGPAAYSLVVSPSTFYRTGRFFNRKRDQNAAISMGNRSIQAIPDAAWFNF